MFMSTLTDLSKETDSGNGSIHPNKIPSSLEPNFLASQDYLSSLLGYAPQATSLQFLSNQEFTEFCQRYSFDAAASGIFLPRSQTACIRLGDDFAPLALFHEYFGHGLYCEQNLDGKHLVDLEQRLLKEEQEHFNDKSFTHDDLQTFRQQHPLFHELHRLRNHESYELFAHWAEYTLAQAADVDHLFERKYGDLAQTHEALARAISFSREYGFLAACYAFNLARKTNHHQVNILLRDVYKEKIDEARCVLLYGSKKEFSDIDVFAVSSNLPEMTTHWLDVRVYSVQDVEQKIKAYDIAITDPLITGDFVCGDHEFFVRAQEQLLTQPITEYALAFNFAQSLQQARFAQEYPKHSPEHRVGMTYALTYLKNALSLKEGKRLLTKEKVLSYSPSEHHHFKED